MSHLPRQVVSHTDGRMFNSFATDLYMILIWVALPKKPMFTPLKLWLIKAHLHWRCFYSNIAGDSDIWQSLLTSLGHLGWRDTDRIISTYVVSPKVAKASTSVSLSRVIVIGVIAPPWLIRHGSKRLICIGKFFWKQFLQLCIVTPFFYLVTLDDTTKLGSFLFTWCLSRPPRQVVWHIDGSMEC